MKENEYFRLGNALKIGAASLILAVGMIGCDIFEPVGEAEYTFRKEGPPSYYYESFEKNDGETSTEHYFIREADDETTLPSISQDWASDGSWSMKIPVGGILSFTMSPHAAGFLRFKASSELAGSIICYMENQTNPSGDTVQVKTAAGFMEKTASLYLRSGTNKLIFKDVDTPVYVDEIEFIPSLIGATPADGSVQTSTPTLDWPDSENGAPYRLQISYFEDFSSTVLDLSGLAVSEYAPTGLLAGKCYFWRVLAMDAATMEDWSTPYRYYAAGPASDDSFETSLFGLSARNAWYGTGTEIPGISTGDASEGTKALRLTQTDTITGDSYIETAVTLDSPKVLRYSYKVKGVTGADGTPVYLYLRRQTADGSTWRIQDGFYQSQTNEAWVPAVELIPAGTHLLRWTFSRTASEGSPGSYALIDDLRFEDPPPFTDDDFEPRGVSGETKFAWGYQGWAPSRIQTSGGVGDSRCVLLPETGRMAGTFYNYSSLLNLIADTGDEPCILAMHIKGNRDGLGITLGGIPGIYVNAGWSEGFYAVKIPGVQTIHAYNNSSMPLILDDPHIIPYIHLGDEGLSEGFESGTLGGQYYFDEFYPPALETSSPHSGAYCLKVGKFIGKNRSFFAFPLASERGFTVSLWLRAEGSSVNGDYFQVIRGSLLRKYFTSIPSAWTKYSFSVSKESEVFTPLNFIFEYFQNSGITVYVDDITITPD